MGVKSNVQGISIAPLKSALQYADNKLGIDVATSSYSDICDALADYFPSFDGTIYDAGMEYVRLDNSGLYVPTSTYTSKGGATLNAGSFSFNTDVTSTAKSSRVIITDEAVDLTDFATLSISTSIGIKTYDVSMINVPVYIFVYAFYESSSFTGIRYGFTTSKSNFFDNLVEVAGDKKWGSITATQSQLNTQIYSMKLTA